MFFLFSFGGVVGSAQREKLHVVQGRWIKVQKRDALTAGDDICSKLLPSIYLVLKDVPHWKVVNALVALNQWFAHIGMDGASDNDTNNNRVVSLKGTVAALHKTPAPTDFTRLIWTSELLFIQSKPTNIDFSPPVLLKATSFTMMMKNFWTTLATVRTANPALVEFVLVCHEVAHFDNAVLSLGGYGGALDVCLDGLWGQAGVKPVAQMSMNPNAALGTAGVTKTLMQRDEAQCLFLHLLVDYLESVWNGLPALIKSKLAGLTCVLHGVPEIDYATLDEATGIRYFQASRHVNATYTLCFGGSPDAPLAPTSVRSEMMFSSPHAGLRVRAVLGMPNQHTATHVVTQLPDTVVAASITPDSYLVSTAHRVTVLLAVSSAGYVVGMGAVKTALGRGLVAPPPCLFINATVDRRLALHTSLILYLLCTLRHGPLLAHQTDNWLMDSYAMYTKEYTAQSTSNADWYISNVCIVDATTGLANAKGLTRFYVYLLMRMNSQAHKGTPRIVRAQLLSSSPLTTSTTARCPPQARPRTCFSCAMPPSRTR